MVKAEWLKPQATVIDVGINRLPAEPGADKGRLVGDVDYGAAQGVAGAITPVPGGVGPMTIAVLLRNTLVAAYRNEGSTFPKARCEARHRPMAALALSACAPFPARAIAMRACAAERLPTLPRWWPPNRRLPAPAQGRRAMVSAFRELARRRGGAVRARAGCRARDWLANRADPSASSGEGNGSRITERS